MDPETQRGAPSGSGRSTGLGPLGVGTWAWGDRILWRYGLDYSTAEVQGAFEASVEEGLRLFDTAEVYGLGRSERFLGQFPHGQDPPIVIATKFFPYPWRWRRGDLLAALRGSLQRLGMGRVDLYQVHFPFPPVSIETWMDGLADAVEAGLARAVGVSNYSTGQMRRAHSALARRGVALASNQVSYHLLDRKPERTGLLEACDELGVTLIAHTPLARGLLTGKYNAIQPPFRAAAPAIQRWASAAHSTPGWPAPGGRREPRRQESRPGGHQLDHLQGSGAHSRRQECSPGQGERRSHGLAAGRERRPCPGHSQSGTAVSR